MLAKRPRGGGVGWRDLGNRRMRGLGRRRAGPRGAGQARREGGGVRAGGGVGRGGRGGMPGRSRRGGERPESAAATVLPPRASEGPSSVVSLKDVSWSKRRRRCLPWRATGSSIPWRLGGFRDCETLSL